MLFWSALGTSQGASVLERVKGTLAARAGFAALDPLCARRLARPASEGRTRPPAGVLVRHS